MAKDKIFKNVTLVSSATIISRISGFLRDTVFFAFFGVSEIGGAFLLAFTLPNMFRKLLGEGALSSAIMPVMSAQHSERGRPEMLKLFNQIFFQLLLVLICALVCSCGLVALIKSHVDNSKWQLALSLTTVLMPYSVLICLAAIVSAALNLLGKFIITSINQVWMNFSMIFSMLFGKIFFDCNTEQLVYFLIVGVWIGGLIQLALPMFALIRLGWRPKLERNTFDTKDKIHEVIKLFLPGVFGAAVEQINLLIARTIAYGFDSAAVSLLYIASRIVEFPVGVFSNAITTVFFPSMAKIISSHAPLKEVNATFSMCLLAIIWILVPSSVGIFTLGKEILSILFQRGSFSLTDVLNAMPILSIYCISMIFSGILQLLVRCFHAMKDTRTPVYVGFLVLITNVTLSLTLPKLVGVAGLAISTTAACIIQCLSLAALLKVKIPKLRFLMDHKSYITTIASCFTVGVIAGAIRFLLQPYFSEFPQLKNLITIAIGATAAASCYFFLTRNIIRKYFLKN